VVVVARCNRGDPQCPSGSGCSRTIWYFKDDCNCNFFWQCVNRNGMAVYSQHCPVCMCFSDVTWVCSDYQPGTTCPPPPPPVTGLPPYTVSVIIGKFTFTSVSKHISTHSSMASLSRFCFNRDNTKIVECIYKNKLYSQ